MHKIFLITFRSFTSLLLVLSFLFPAALFSQTQPPIAAWLNTYRDAADFRQVPLFSLNPERSDYESVVNNATLLHPDEDALDQLLQTAPTTMTFTIPQNNGAVLELELAKVEILAPDCSFGTKGIAPQEHFSAPDAVHYRGIIRGNEASIAAISITSSGVSGMVSNESGTFQLGQLEDNPQKYIFYKTSDLLAQSPNSCHADDHALLEAVEQEISPADRGVGCKTVNIYFECDYKLYTDKGSSVTTVNNYVTSLFNQVATLYANENVGVAISQIYVWTSPDPYTVQTNISNVLNAFRQTMGTTFNGNLAHLLSTRSLGGGIAYVDVICFKQYAFGVSCINTSFQNVPTYSWSVEVLTHELGHNLGSWHTQSCNWTNGALDNCVSPEGSCAPGPAPANGGTIMSYCHLTAYGINFNNGFGPQPGAKIRDKVLNATCLSPSGAAPGNLTTTNITGVSVTLNWGAVAGATTYTVQYKAVSAGSWTNAGNTTATVMNISNLSNNTAYTWQVKTDCSNFSTTANFTTSTGGGSECNAPTGMVSTNITTLSATLSWAVVPGATNYTVQYKVSTSSVWQTAGNTTNVFYNLSGLSSATTYNWRVKASCSSYSASRSFTTTSAGGGGSCSAPVNLSNNQIASTSASISWSPVTGASSYTLQLKHANSVNYVTLGTVPVTAVTLNGLQAATAYHWRVKANCSFYSTSKLLTTLASMIGESNGAYLVEPAITYVTEPVVDIYPNPANEVLLVASNTEWMDHTSIKITNTTGALVLEQVLNTHELETLDVSKLASGVYFVSIQQSDKPVITRKVVIVR
jgi:hypothetical protein